MAKQNYPELDQKLLGLFVIVSKLKDFKVFKKNVKMMTLFNLMLICHFSVAVVIGNFCYVNWNKFSLAALAEPLAILVVTMRQVIFLLFYFKNRFKIEKLLKSIATDRKRVKVKDKHWSVTVKHCRIEVIATCMCTAALCFALFFVLFAGVSLFPNKYHLPMNFNIVGLPFDGTSFNRAVTYLYQVTFVIKFCIVFFLYLVTTLILMNHSCWYLDSTLAYVEHLDSALNRGNDPPSHPLQLMSIRRNLRKVKDSVADSLKWQNKTIPVLQLTFLAIFAMQCINLCMWMLSMSTNLDDSFIAVIGMLLWLSELFVYCLMGSRVMTRLNKLTTALHGLSWDQMVPSHRKDLVLVLLMSQNIKGFHGVFKPVELATFQNILEFSYTFLTMLRVTGQER